MFGGGGVVDDVARVGLVGCCCSRCCSRWCVAVVVAVGVAVGLRATETVTRPEWGEGEGGHASVSL